MPFIPSSQLPQYYKGHVRHPNKDHLIALSHRHHGPKLQHLRKVLNPPSSWDSRTLGIIGAIKDQSQCGSCWDFSGTFVVEVALYKAHILTPDKALSEQYTLDCGRNGGCGGDDNVTVLDWAKKTGLPLTSDYGPYHAHSGSCQFKPAETLYKISSWGFADANGGNGVTPIEDIKNAIMLHGCVGCAVDAGFRDPGQGVISGSGHNIDHDVALIGWDDSKGSKGAWLMRNSWGTGWANQGYAWIEYGAYDIGTEAVWAEADPVVSPVDWMV